MVVFCRLLGCPTVTAPSHGYMQGYSTQAGSTIVFNCIPPYQLQGPITITCRNGAWTQAPPKCVCKYSVMVIHIHTRTHARTHAHTCTGLLVLSTSPTGTQSSSAENMQEQQVQCNTSRVTKHYTLHFAIGIKQQAFLQQYKRH